MAIYRLLLAIYWLFTMSYKGDEEKREEEECIQYFRDHVTVTRMLYYKTIQKIEKAIEEGKSKKYINKLKCYKKAYKIICKGYKKEYKSLKLIKKIKALEVRCANFIGRVKANYELRQQRIKEIVNIYFEYGKVNYNYFYDKKCINIVNYILQAKKPYTLIFHMHGTYDYHVNIEKLDNVQIYNMVPEGKKLYVHNLDFYDMMDNFGKKWLSPIDVQKSMEYWCNITVNCTCESVYCCDCKYRKDIYRGYATANVQFSFKYGDDLNESWGMYVIEDKEEEEHISGRRCVNLLNLDHDDYYYKSYIMLGNIIYDVADYMAKEKIIYNDIDLNLFIQLMKKNKYNTNVNIILATCQSY